MKSSNSGVVDNIGPNTDMALLNKRDALAHGL
eukprot:CAMPEP_0177678252 /NCGR_PEP_ID=MMETSP0447-20121125/28908_1 /TAXON_ID=0 /ORGANISM="Stygamoeba regulata, Strain BSH-02190019" /LENGTH=31 /DNA_ID= /DNA_START= /DNA_END= /DNA_ORIENTATION=